MKRILVNDGLLRRERTGVGQYLASLVAHWPADARVQLVGFHFQRLLGQPSMPACRFEFPALPQVPAVRLRPLAELNRPRPRLVRKMLGWSRPARDRVYGSLRRRERARAVYAAFFEPNHLVEQDLQPTVAAMHDLSILELPHFHPAERVAFWERRLAQALHWTTHWVCGSQATAAAMEQLLGVRRELITVIPYAARWQAPPPAWTPPAVRTHLGLPPRYLVCLGTIEPRKNIGRLLDAYAAHDPGWRAHTPLVLAGMPGWGDEPFWQALRAHPMARHVFTTGYLTDAQAAAVVRGASALLYPSLYEGFGMPPLEAMVLGVPVAASLAASVREVCADAAAGIDPADTHGWAEWMGRLSEAGPQRDRLIDKGRQRVEHFSWQTTARRHHDLFDRLAAADRLSPAAAETVSAV